MRGKITAMSAIPMRRAKVISTLVEKVTLYRTAASGRTYPQKLVRQMEATRLELIERTELHDSSLVEMTSDGDRVCLRFENVWVDDDNCYSVTIHLDGVRKLMHDNIVVKNLRMETEDGGVIAFKRSGNIANLVVTWTSYAPRTDKTHSYEVDFTTFDLQARKQE